MRHPFLKAILFALALLVGAELAARLFFSRSLAGRFDYGYHPTVGFEEKAGGTVNLTRSGGRKFFPQTFPRQRPEGTLRIMGVGDSVSRGPGLPASYVVQLAGQLAQAGIPTEGINLSLPGYGAHRKRIVLEQALKYAPSVIVLHVNNSNEYEDEREYKRAEEFKSWHPRNWPMKSLVLRRLYEMKTEKVFWSLLPQEIRAQQGVSDADAEIATALNPAKLREWDERVRRYTTESVAMAKARGVPVVLVAQAVVVPDGPGKTRLDDRGLDAFARSLAGDQVWVVSMKEVLAPLDYEKLYSRDGTHVAREGHEALAKAIGALLKEKGLAHR